MRDEDRKNGNTTKICIKEKKRKKEASEEWKKKIGFIKRMRVYFRKNKKA